MRGRRLNDKPMPSPHACHLPLVLLIIRLTRAAPPRRLSDDAHVFPTLPFMLISFSASCRKVYALAWVYFDASKVHCQSIMSYLDIYYH